MRGVVSPEAIGRGDELAALADAVTAAADAAPSLVLVAGEAGIGKTRLCRDIGRAAQEGGVLVLRGECLRLEGGEFPYAPVVGALRSIDPALLEQALPAVGRAEISRLLPELDADVAAEPQERYSAHAQSRLFELLLGLLRRVGDTAPVLLIIEDAQWADRSTRDFIVFLVRNLTSERIAVVVTYRDEEVTPRHPLLPVVSELRRRADARALTLRRLQREEVEAQLDAILGRAAERRLVDQVYARSGGVPFNVEELLAAHLYGEGDEIPASIRDALMLRFEALPPDARTLLRALAVIGRPADVALLQAVAALEDRRVADAIRAALDAQLVFFRREDERFEFRHALMREAVARGVLPWEAHGLHVAVADALVAEGTANAAELAFHLESAGRRQEAFRARVDAGLQAERVLASTEACEHFEQALRLAAGSDVDGSACALGWVDLLHHAAETSRRAGKDELAAERMRQAISALDADAEPVRAAYLQFRLGDCFLWDDDAALERYRAALDLLPEGHTSERVRVLGATARALHNMRRWRDALAPAGEALALASAHASAVPHSYDAHLALGISLTFLGDPEAGEHHIREGRRLADAHGAPEDRSRAITYLGEVLRIRGRFAEAYELMQRAEADVAALGLTESFGRAISVNAAEDLLRIGRWAEAGRRLERLGRLDLRGDAELLHRLLCAQLAASRGENDSARAELDAANAIALRENAAADYCVSIAAVAAELALYDGRPKAALEVVLQALATVRPLEDPLYVPALYALGARAVADAVERARGRRSAERAVAPEVADDLVEGLDALRRAHGDPVEPPELVAILAACRAEAARARGVPAAELWDEVEGRFVALGQPYPAAYAALRLAAAQRDRGRRAAAAEALERARVRAAALEAAPLLAAIRSLHEAWRLPARGTARSRPTDDLTPRELDVVRLLADGCSNPEIARRLVISEHTAKRHVDNLLRKLGVTKRQAAVAEAYRRNLLDSVRAPD